MELKNSSAQVISNILLYNEKISFLDVSRNNLGDEGISIIASSFPFSKTLVHLDLSSTSLSYKGAICLFSKLIQNETISCLIISSSSYQNRNNLQNIEIPELTQYLVSTNQLYYFSLSGVNLGDKGLDFLVRGMVGNNSVHSLDISENQLSDSSVINIHKLFLIKQLIDIKMGNNKLKDIFKMKLCNEIRKGQPLCIKYLNMKNCNFTAINSPFFFKTMSFGLIELNLDNNLLNECDKDTFIYLLTESILLKKVSFSYCEIGDKEAENLALGILKTMSLDTLVLSNNYITNFGAFCLSKALTNQPCSIVKLDLSYNKIKNKGAYSFFRENITLENLSLKANNLNNKAGKKILEISAQSKTLIYLNIDLNSIDLYFIDGIQKILKRNNKSKKKQEIEQLEIFVNTNNNYDASYKESIKELQYLTKKLSKETQNLEIIKNEYKIALETDYSHSDSMEMKLSEIKGKNFSLNHNTRNLDLEINRKEKEIDDEKDNQRVLDISISQQLKTIEKESIIN